MILVVADDLTGAAELGGAAVARGLSAWWVRQPPWPEDAAVLCLDTRTRDLPPADAAARVREGVAPWAGRTGLRVYKKVDSVLRGPVLAEVEAVRSALGFRNVLLLPANPSRGRIIRDGHYFIGGVPLDRTEFARDPVHPRVTSDVLALVGRMEGVEVRLAGLDEPLPTSGIVIAQAGSEADVARWAARWGEETLPAGGLDFFRALLDRWLPQRPEHATRSTALSGRVAVTCQKLTPPGTIRRVLLVSGTASPRAREWRQQCGRAGVPVECLFSGDESDLGDLASVAERIGRACANGLAAEGRAMLCLGEPARAASLGDQPSVWLDLLACAARMVCERVTPDLVLVEGGATAAALLDEFPWDRWRIQKEWAPGVVELCGPDRSGPALVLKPGSYPWPEAIRRLWFNGRTL
jgi:uncharacterized protein YgbK (DUF1537 family)